MKNHLEKYLDKKENFNELKNYQKIILLYMIKFCSCLYRCCY